MADVLDQAEVDALLAAVDSGQLAEEAGAPGDRVAKGPGDVLTYDFKRPERVSKDQMRALQGIHEGFARNFGASLSSFLRTIVDVRVATAEQLTYSEFISSLPTPTCFNLLSAAPLEGEMALELSPLIIYPIIDRLLGGSSAEIFIPQRPLTSIEQSLVNRITDRALVNLTESWVAAVEVEFKLTQTESNPHLVQNVAPNEVVVVIGFEVKMGTRAGTMSLCIPFNVIEPVIGSLATQSWLAYRRRGASSEHIQRITTNIERSHVSMRAFLGETTITLGELMELQAGDILRTDKSCNAELMVQVEGRNKMAGRLGQIKGNRAIMITRSARGDEIL